MKLQRRAHTRHALETMRGLDKEFPVRSGKAMPSQSNGPFVSEGSWRLSYKKSEDIEG